MACGICGSSGHNRRTHAEHDAPQGTSLIEALEQQGNPVLTGLDDAPDDYPGSGWYEGYSAGQGHSDNPGKADPANVTPSCPWCPAGCPECAGSREDCECYRHQPEASGLDEFAPEVVQAVSRIDDEMATPHERGCTVAAPLLVPGPGVVIERGTVDPTDDDQPILDEIIGLADRVREHVDTVHPDAECTAACDLMGIITQPPWLVADDLVADAIYESEGEPPLTNVADYHLEVEAPYDQEGYDALIRMAAAHCHHEMCRHHDEADCDGSCDDDDLGSDGPEASDLEWDIVPPWRTALGPDEPIRITEPGVYQLTAAEYHSFEVTGDWISNSDVKALLQSCPAQFDYDRRHAVRKTSDAFDFGHVWHSVILGKGEAYQVFEPKKLDGRTGPGKAQKAEVDAARAAGITPIYGDQFALIEAMAEAVKADPVPYGLLNSLGRSEVCLFWREQVKVTDPANKLYGQVVTVQRRAMIDHLPDMPADPDETVILVDGKTAEDVKPDDDMRKKVYDYGYHRQADTYESAVRALLGREAQVMFVFQSKKPPHLVVPVEMDTPAMRVAAAQNHQALQVWAECVATGEWPGYVTNGVATSGVPAWIERQYEEAIEVI